MLWLNRVLPWIIYAVVLLLAGFIIVEIVLLFIYICKRRSKIMTKKIKMVKNYNKTDQFDMSECQTIYYWMETNLVEFKVVKLTTNTISVIAEPANETEVEHLKLYGFNEMEDKT